jgi:hypothetical protein
MVTEGKEFFQYLSGLGALEWGRLADGRSHSERLAPPLLVWRFVDPGPADFDKPIESVVHSPTRLIAWRFCKPGRNWVLTPQRVWDVQTSRSLGTDSMAISAIAEEDPSFCATALDDLGQIVAELKSVANDG